VVPHHSKRLNVRCASASTQERQLHLQRFGRGTWRGPRGHGHAISLPSSFVDGDQVIEGDPVSRRISVPPDTNTGRGAISACRSTKSSPASDQTPCTTRFAGCPPTGCLVCAEPGDRSQVPRLPVIDVAIPFVEYDARIRPDGTREFVVQTRGEHGPLAAVRQADDADPLWIDFRQLGQRGVGSWRPRRPAA